MPEPTLAQRVRLHIFEHFLEHARPPLVEELMGTFGLSRAGVEAAIDDLVATRGVSVVKGTKRILMAWPFSAVATEFAERG